MSDLDLESVSVRLPKLQVQKLDLLRNKSIFHISRTAIIRKLLDEALVNRGITDHVLEYSRKNSSEE